MADSTPAKTELVESYGETLDKLNKHIETLPKGETLVFIVDNNEDHAFLAAHFAKVNGVNEQSIIVITESANPDKEFYFIDLDSIDLDCLGTAGNKYDGRSIYILDWDLGKGRGGGLWISGKLRSNNVKDTDVIYYTQDVRVLDILEANNEQHRCVIKPMEEFDKKRMKGFITGEA